mgnify:FL=1
MAKQYDDILLSDILPDSISDIIEVKNAANIIDPELLSASLAIREALLLSRINELPENVIDLLAWQYHVDMYEPLALPISQKRAQVQKAILLHRYKGSPWAIKQSLENLGFQQIKIEEWWTINTLPHTFQVEVYPLTEEKMRQAERCINEYKPVRSHMIALSGKLIVGILSDETEAETISAVETAAIVNFSVLHEVYPWPELVYGDMNTGFRYGLVTDPGVARYGIYDTAEKIKNTIRNCIVEYAFAKHAYGEDGLLYDGSIQYGQDSVLTEKLHDSVAAAQLVRDIVDPGDIIINTFYVIL